MVKTTTIAELFQKILLHTFATACAHCATSLTLGNLAYRLEGTQPSITNVLRTHASTSVYCNYNLNCVRIYLDPRNGQPRLLAVMDTVFASTGVTRRNTYEEFEAIMGKTEARGGARRYTRAF